MLISAYYLVLMNVVLLEIFTLFMVNIIMNWMKKVGISRLQPYATVTNLFTFTKYLGFDPEVNQWGNSGNVQGMDYGTYPQTRSFIFGVNVDI